jgi:hypothetical protein
LSTAIKRLDGMKHDLSFLIFAAALYAYVYAGVSGRQAATLHREAIVSGHKYQIGQLVNYLSRERASGFYQITQLLPPEGEAFQYRIKNVNEPHERIAKEYELRKCVTSAPELRHVFLRL